MGNKVVISPLANYETSAAMFNKNELIELRAKFMNRSDNANTLNVDKFIRKSNIESDYIQKHILTRFFTICDTKKDDIWDYEEYVCVVALFRYSTLEDRIKFIYLMYLDSNKSNVLLKENFRQVIVDCLVCLRKVGDTDRDILLNGTTEKWVQELQLLSQAIVESNLLLYSNQVNKIDLNDFVVFAKSEGGSLAGLYDVLIQSIDS